MVFMENRIMVSTIYNRKDFFNFLKAISYPEQKYLGSILNVLPRKRSYFLV